jgi:hypothetical protein
MARKLKTYQTSLGFRSGGSGTIDEGWLWRLGAADSNLFHQGAAMQSEDPDIIEATMVAPGVVLKRPVGSSGHAWAPG